MLTHDLVVKTNSSVRKDQGVSSGMYVTYPDTCYKGEEKMSEEEKVLFLVAVQGDFTTLEGLEHSPVLQCAQAL